MRDFNNLDIWKRSHQLTIKIYRISQRFPREEIYGQTSQLRRAAVSIPTNIAEGCGRKSNSEFANFLNIAAGSASEVEYELLLAREVGYLTEDEYKGLYKEICEIRRMLNVYMKKLTADS